MFCHVRYRKNNKFFFSREYIYVTLSRDYSTIQYSQLLLHNGDSLCFLYCRNSILSIECCIASVLHFNSPAVLRNYMQIHLLCLFMSELK